MASYCANDRCWEFSPCSAHEETKASSFEEAVYDDDVGFVGDDLAFISSVFIDQYQTRIKASEDVMDAVDRHFDASNRAKTTKLDSMGECELCDGPRFQASCDVPAKNGMPQLTLVSTTCTSCKDRNVSVSVGETRTVHTPTKITLEVSSVVDLERDVVKSETARVEIPELGLELEPGTLGNRYTTLGGLVSAITQDMSSAMMFAGAEGGLETFLATLEDLHTGNTPWTLILDDDFGRSFVGGPSKGVTVVVRPPTSGESA